MILPYRLAVLVKLPTSNDWMNLLSTIDQHEQIKLDGEIIPDKRTHVAQIEVMTSLSQTEFELHLKERGFGLDRDGEGVLKITEAYTEEYRDKKNETK